MKKDDIRKCPKCGVICGYVQDSRQGEDGRIYRKRYCPFCKTKWKTIERLLEDIRVEGHVT